MTARMTKEEFEGLQKRFGMSGYSDICHILLMKTGAILRPDNVRTHLDRHGSFSPAYTATFRMLFRELERAHEAN